MPSRLDRFPRTTSPDEARVMCERLAKEWGDLGLVIHQGDGYYVTTALSVAVDFALGHVTDKDIVFRWYLPTDECQHLTTQAELTEYYRDI